MAREDNNGGEVPPNPKAVKKGGLFDKLLLVAASIVVTVVFVTAFWLIISHNWSPMWVFFVGNSIVLGLVLAKYFEAELGRPYFKLALAIWTIAHGGLAVTLSRMRVSVAMWPFFFLLELVVGYLIIIRLFSIRGRRSANDR